MIAEGPTEEELAQARVSLDSGFRRTFGTGFAAAGTFAGLEGRGVGLDFYASLRAAYAATTAAAVRAAAAKYLAPERQLILCVGDLEAMRAGDGVHPDRLEDFGEATVHEPDAAAAKPVAPAGPAGVAMEMIARLKSGDLDGFKSHLAKDLRTRIEANPQSSMQLSMFQRMFGKSEFTEPEVKEGEGSTVVTTKTTVGRQAREMTFALRMVKEDGVWKCAEFGAKRPEPGAGSGK
jgi:hypothetical protein